MQIFGLFGLGLFVRDRAVVSASILAQAPHLPAKNSSLGALDHVGENNNIIIISNIIS